MNSLARDIALIDQLRAEPAEAPWLEFKGNNADPKRIGKRCFALTLNTRGRAMCRTGPDFLDRSLILPGVGSILLV